MRKLLKWFLMLNKRLYKKAAFVVLLVLIPVSVLAYSIVSRQDSGFLHIVLAQTDATDAVSSAVVEELLSEESIVHFSKALSPRAAVEAVKTGQADEAWIFPANMQQKVNEFVTGNGESAVRVVAREQTVFLRLSHEKLTAALYKYNAKAKYIDFARTNSSALDSLTDSELMQYYDNLSIDEELFVFGNHDTAAEPHSGAGESYLTSPIRGLLSIIVLLCGMAAAMYYMQDERSGTFSWVPQANRIYVAFACLVIAVLNVAAVALISLYTAGLASSLLMEIISIILYSASSAVFCLILKQIFGSIRLYGSVIPLLTVVMIAVCPVFFDFRVLIGVQLLFPPTYYVNAAYDSRYLLYMAVYSVVGAALCLVIDRLKRVKLRYT